MNAKVADLMIKNVVTAEPHQTVGQLKHKLTSSHLKVLPIVSTDNEPLGVISVSDLLAAEKDGTPVSKLMTRKVYTIPEYEKVAIAARMMRNHKIHHLVVTSEQKVIGMISSYDLLQLVEGHRFEMKNPSTPKSKGKGRRARAEA
jgi:predicted transcriptional regulator